MNNKLHVLIFKLINDILFKIYNINDIKMIMKYIKGWESYNESNESNPQQFDYMMLSRLQRDCEYYLGYGGRHEKHLWANTVEEHIAEMKKLWNGLIEKPEWLSMEDILDYEKQMTTDNEGGEYITDTDTDSII